MGDQQLAQIDVSHPNFLAQDNLPLVVLPLQRILPEAVAAPEEEIASSSLSLEEEIDKFQFKCLFTSIARGGDRQIPIRRRRELRDSYSYPLGCRGQN